MNCHLPYTCIQTRPVVHVYLIWSNWIDLYAPIFMQLFQSYRPYDHKVGERQLVLATELSHDQQHYVAHNKFYEQV